MPSTPTIIKEAVAIAEAAIKGDLSEATNKVSLTDSIIQKVSRKFREKLRSMGKNETVSVDKIVELNNKRQMPTMIKHCVVAVQPKLKGEGATNSFIGAHNICFWSFQRHKLLTKEGKVSGRGSLRERYHRSKDDPDANKKTQKYDKFFNKIFK